jgi:sulfur carrier protein
VIVLNGEPRDDCDGATVAELVGRAGIDPHGARGVAVAVDAEVVPRGQWPTTTVRSGATVEVLTAMQGG